jgi:hypothetical protein
MITFIYINGINSHLLVCICNYLIYFMNLFCFWPLFYKDQLGSYKKKTQKTNKFYWFFSINNQSNPDTIQNINNKNIGLNRES